MIRTHSECHLQCLWVSWRARVDEAWYEEQLFLCINSWCQLHSSSTFNNNNTSDITSTTSRLNVNLLTGEGFLWPITQVDSFINMRWETNGKREAFCINWDPAVLGTWVDRMSAAFLPRRCVLAWSAVIDWKAYFRKVFFLILRLYNQGINTSMDSWK